MQMIVHVEGRITMPDKGSQEANELSIARILQTLEHCVKHEMPEIAGFILVANQVAKAYNGTDGH